MKTCRLANSPKSQTSYPRLPGGLPTSKEDFKAARQLTLTGQRVECRMEGREFNKGLCFRSVFVSGVRFRSCSFRGFVSVVRGSFSTGFEGLESRVKFSFSSADLGSPCPWAPLSPLPVAHLSGHCRRHRVLLSPLSARLLRCLTHQ